MILSTDPIADMLTRIRNATVIRSRSVAIPYSRVKRSLAEALASAGWVESVSAQGTPPRTLVIGLKYDETGSSVIRGLRRVSTPGRRVYVGRSDLPIVANNFGIAVISTPAGMMTNREARRRGLGGEVMCEVF